MRHRLMPILAAAMLAGGVQSAPVHAQQFSEGYTFLKAVRERDGDVVTEALKKPGSIVVNARDVGSGQTALHIVIERRDPVWIRFLTGSGADPNIADKRGVTPLQIAASMGYAEGAELLLAAGANPNPTDRTGETPLIAAVHQNNLPLVRLLLSKGAKPDHADNSGRTALDYAKLDGARTPLMQEFERAARERTAAGAASTYGPGR